MFATAKADLVDSHQQLNGSQPPNNEDIIIEYPYSAAAGVVTPTTDSPNTKCNNWRRSFKHFAEAISLPGISDFSGVFPHSSRLRIQSSTDESSSGGDGSWFEREKRQRRRSKKEIVILLLCCCVCWC